MTTSDIVTDDQIRDLQTEAGAHGDHDTVADCAAALAGNAAARARVAQILANARAQQD